MKFNKLTVDNVAEVVCKNINKYDVWIAYMIESYTEPDCLSDKTENLEAFVNTSLNCPFFRENHTIVNLGIIDNETGKSYYMNNPDEIESDSPNSYSIEKVLDLLQDKRG